MLNSFFQAICRVGIFMICAQAIVHFRAQDAYEKYLKFLVSIMILIQLLLPIGSFLLGGQELDVAEVLELMKEGMEQGVRAAEENAAAADEILGQMTLEEIRRRVEEQKQSDEKDNSDGDIIVEDIEIEVEEIAPVVVGPVSSETSR